MDWYKLTTTAGRGYLIDMIGGGEYAGDVRDPLIVGVYDTDSNYIVNTRNDNGRASGLYTDNARSYFTASSTGTYYIAVTANGNPHDVVADLGTYRLWVTEIDPDVPASAHEMTTAVVTEATDYRGEVETLGDRDWIRAELTEDVTYRFTIDEGEDGNSAYSLNIWGIYHDSTSSLVPFNYRGTVEFTPDTTGTYYVSAACNGWGDFRHYTGSYILRMEILSPDNQPAAGVPTISGTVRVGEELTADTSSITDANGLTNVSYEYQWIASDSNSDVEITNATASTYTVAEEDAGRTIQVRVTFTDDVGYQETLTSDATGAVDFAVQPQRANTPATGTLTISGTAQVGWMLTADTSGIADADGLTNATYGYQWIASNGRSDVEIANATAPTYTVAAEDEGWTIQVRVTFTDDADHEQSLTSAVTALAQPPAPDGPPDTPNRPNATAVFVGGVDLEWNAVFGAESYDVQLGRGGQWIDLPGGGVEVAFYGAGAIISGLDPEASLWFQVRAVNARGVSDWSEMLYTGSTSQFRLGRQARPDNEPASGAPVIHGTAQVGESLWGEATGIEDGNGLDRVQFRYQWTSNEGSADTDITGATNSGYTLVADDVGQTIQVKVAFTDRGGYSETRTSVATGAVAARPNNPATGGPTIGGRAEVGETLTADTSGIADADGLVNATYSYQWVANDGTTDTDISGETDASYTLVADDAGQTIKVRVIVTDDAGNETTLTSAATEIVSFAVQQQQASNTPATGKPTISGAVQVGETLTADTTGIADADGLTKVSYSYQWVANDGGTDTDISGETDASYTLVADDEGNTIKVRVTFKDDADNDETLTSAATDEVSFAVQQQQASNTPATGAPTIGGRAEVGEKLTVDTSGIADADGLSNVSYNYQWVANDGGTDADISGERDASYTLVADDEGKTIKVRVIVTDDAENETTLTSAATDEVSFAVQQQQASNTPATGGPTIGGRAEVGETLTADTSGIADADGLSNVSYNYQWVANDEGTDADISGETDTGYTLVADDVGKTIKVKVSFKDDADNQETLTSAATEAVAARPNTSATGLPTISGTVRVGETLTADTSGIADADGLSNVSYHYQWVANDEGADADISGERDASYTLVADDVGKTIKVRVSFTDDADNQERLTSAATEAVFARPNTSATGLPTISGTVRVGEVLTADTTGIADVDGLSNVSYGYQWIAGGTDLGGATASTYTLTAGERGKTIKVRVSFTDDADNQERLTSAATEAVAARPNTSATGLPTISGTVRVGEVLTADTTGIGDADGLTNVSYSYQWVVTDGGAYLDISGETGATYTLVAIDRGLYIQVRVSFTDDAGNREKLTSAVTEAVAAAP